MKNFVFIALSGTFIGWKLEHLQMIVILFEILTHLSPNLRTRLLPSRSQWTILSMYTVTRYFCSRICSLYLYSHRLKSAKFQLAVVFPKIFRRWFKKCLEFSTLLRSPDASIRPRIAEPSGGIDICAKPLETRFKTLFSILTVGNSWPKNFVIGRNICRC